MNNHDRAILKYCHDDFQALKPLLKQMPQGTLYRHVNGLVKLGWLERNGRWYRTTEAGCRQVAQAESGRRWESLEDVYPPLVQIPTLVHRKLIELIFAAIVARRHPSRSDRHPFFACFGGTFRWKTSAGLFVMQALGLDPAIHIVECGSETGKSMAFRRSGRGTLAFKRELLDASFVVLDEFLMAERDVRATLGLLLSGRLVVPFENEQISIRPVPLLTLNPRDKTTLEGRLGLSAPQIRRGLLVNLDTVAMPDLAAGGELALLAARAHPPLVLTAPAQNCQSFHDPIVKLIREIICSEAQERLDVEVVMNLCTGMTALIPDPADAIPHVAHAIGVLLETMNWVQPGWIEPVLQFSLVPTKPQAVRPSMVQETPKEMPKAGPAHAARSLSLELPRVTREPGLPSLSLSDEFRGRLAWLAVETGQPAEDVLKLLIRCFQMWRRDGRAFDMLLKIVDLSRQLHLEQVEVETLGAYLADRATLAQEGCSFEDVPEALRFIRYLGDLPTDWDWPMVRKAIQGVALIMRIGLEPEHVREFLVSHVKLAQLEFDVQSAVAVATALDQAGARGGRRAAILKRLIGLAGQQVDLGALALEEERLQGAIPPLRAQLAEATLQCQEAQARLDYLRREEIEIQARTAHLGAEAAAQAEDLDVLRDFRGLLLGRRQAVEALWADLEQLLALRSEPKPPLGSVVLTPLLRQRLLEFFQRLLAEAAAV